MSLSNVLSCVLRRSALSRRRQQTLRKPVASLALAALAVLGLAGPVAAEEQVPFKGSLEGVETRTSFAFPFVSILGEWTGNATHLGRFTVENPHTVNVLTMSGSGSFDFTAANGDTVTADESGQAFLTQTPGVLSIVEHATITGGTGRFAGATGSFTVERLLDTVTHTTFGSFNGTSNSRPPVGNSS
jgi:hypothetical protein